MLASLGNGAGTQHGVFVLQSGWRCSGRHGVSFLKNETEKNKQEKGQSRQHGRSFFMNL
jgi:hypothetical protein